MSLLKNGEKKDKRKLILISIIALFVIGGIIAAALLLGKGNGDDPQPTDPSKEPSVPAEVPCVLWDMEALPDDLIAGGVAYANSNENIFGNVELHGANNKGINGSRAFEYYQVGSYSGGDSFMMTAASMNTKADNWSNAEMLWFWVNGTELTSQIRLDIMINGMCPLMKPITPLTKTVIAS